MWLPDGSLLASCSYAFLHSDEANIHITVFVWIYIINFAYSWGPGSWILITEIFPSPFEPREPPSVPPQT